MKVDDIVESIGMPYGHMFIIFNLSAWLENYVENGAAFGDSLSALRTCVFWRQVGVCAEIAS